MKMVKKLVITISSNKPLCEFESWDPANHWWFRVTGLLGSLCRVHYINCSQRPQILVILVSTQLMFWYCIFSMTREIRFGKDCHLSRCTHTHTNMYLEPYWSFFRRPVRNKARLVSNSCAFIAVHLQLFQCIIVAHYSSTRTKKNKKGHKRTLVMLVPYQNLPFPCMVARSIHTHGPIDATWPWIYPPAV